MVATVNWAFMIYQLPREPSTPRISVWRKLKRLGVAQLSDGLVALPYDASTKEQLEWVAHEITEAGGKAAIWIATPAARRFGEDLANELARARAAEYLSLLEEAGLASTREPEERARIQRRLRAQCRRIERRDYFPPPEKTAVRDALDRLTDSARTEASS